MINVADKETFPELFVPAFRLIEMNNDLAEVIYQIVCRESVLSNQDIESKCCFIQLTTTHWTNKETYLCNHDLQRIMLLDFLLGIFYLEKVEFFI